MSQPAARGASYEEVLATPLHLVAEVVQGVLYQSPRPSTPHALAASALGEELGPPFKRGRGGPGGWVILDEPELHLDDHILVPDLVGWRRERLPEVPDAPYLTLAPDWICEVLSPSTRALDRGAKLGVYGSFHVAYIWLVEPLDRLLEVLRLDGDSYRIVGSATGNERVRFKPFDAIELELTVLWAR
ncbi:MAG TPA: Uma2 family endonuclease [Polyangiaceae bacterium]